MNPRILLAVCLLGVPLLEIYLFIKVGRAIGVWPTLALVVLIALVGASQLRIQGLAVLRRVQQSLSRREWPADDLLEGMAVLVGGLLLLIPGFFTDLIGLLLLWPPARKTMLSNLLSRIRSTGRFELAESPGPRQEPDRGRIIEGEYTRDPDE
jgi:UPF0716 protein FxsA